MTAPFAPHLTATDEEIRTRFAALGSRSDVAWLLEVDPIYLNRLLIVRQARRRYRQFIVPKRLGGIREISAPPPSLAVLQSKLNKILQVVYRPKPCVQGFVKARSIMSNARPHAGKRWLLNIDLADFFPSIHFGRVRGMLKASPFGLSEECATILAQICTTHEGRLPQGAPTSPMIANLVCSRLDGELMALASRYRMTFTRYCDDLSFSTRQAQFPAAIATGGPSWVGERVILGPAIRELIEANGFLVNPAKTRLQLRSGRQEVTGLVVNEFPNVSRKYIRELRVLLHNWNALGLEAAARIHFERNGVTINADRAASMFRLMIRGRVEHVGMVRGRTDPIYCKLRQRLHERDRDLISPAPLPGGYPSSLRRSRGALWSRIFARVATRVYHLVAVTQEGDQMSGSAFAIAPGVLVTAAHNLERSSTVAIDPAGLSVVCQQARLHPRGPQEVDAAALAHSHTIVPLEYADRLPDPGESVAVVGFATVPNRQPGQGVFAGSVESIRWNLSQTTKFIHVSVASGGGLSGAPLIDRGGRVLGVVVESVFEATGEGVPSREFCTVLPIRYVVETLRTGNLEQLPIQFQAGQLGLFQLPIEQTPVATDQ